jgi:hypothetical protein
MFECGALSKTSHTHGGTRLSGRRVNAVEKQRRPDEMALGGTTIQSPAGVQYRSSSQFIDIQVRDEVYCL